MTVQDELDLERNHVGGCDQVEHGRGVLGPEGRGRLRVWEKFFHLLHLHNLANVDMGLPSQRGSIHLEEIKVFDSEFSLMRLKHEKQLD